MGSAKTPAHAAQGCMGTTMPAYWLGFRVHSGSANGRTYSNRRDGLLEAIEDECTNKYHLWDDTTSFIIFETSSTNCAAIARRLSVRLSREVDVILIRAMDFKNAAVFGVNHAKELRKFMVDGDKSYLIDVTPPN